MSWLDKVLGRKSPQRDAAEPGLDGIPNLDAPSTTETLGAAAARAHEARRKATASAPEAPPLVEELPSVNRRKKGSNFVNVLGIVVILVVGGALAWKMNAPKEPKKPKSAQTDKVANNLPRLELPKPTAPQATPATPPGAATPLAADGTDAAGGQVPAPVGGTAAIPVRPAGAKGAQPAGAPGPRGAGNGGGQGKEPMTWEERKQLGDVMLQAKQQRGEPGERPGSEDGTTEGLQMLREVIAAQNAGGGAGGGPRGGAGETADAPSGGNLGGRLQPTRLKGVSAGLLPDRNLLLTKGTPMDCVLDTAIITSLPSVVVCHLTRDVYSANGQVLLMERGTKLVGEQQGSVRRGAARIFAIWSRAETPHGVIIELNSPGTDALGRGGLEGWVDNHFAERFGAAILMSLIQDSLKALVERASSRDGQANTSVYTAGSAESGGKVVEKILESTVNIPPTVIKNQGDHIQVMVARDLDFSTVYQLRKAR